MKVKCELSDKCENIHCPHLREHLHRGGCEKASTLCMTIQKVVRCKTESTTQCKTQNSNVGSKEE